MSNIDFGGFIDDDNMYEDDVDELGFEEYLTVEALLCLKYGDKRGRAIYKLLAKYARRATADMGGEPGLIFDEDGGEFVSFDDTLTAEQE